MAIFIDTHVIMTMIRLIRVIRHLSDIFFISRLLRSDNLHLYDFGWDRTHGGAPQGQLL